MKRLRSLLIDDEPNARMRLHRLLKDEERVEVIGEAKDGFEAVAEIERLKPDLVFLDIQMPGLDGFETLKALSPELPLPPVIFVTGFHEILEFFGLPSRGDNLYRLTPQCRHDLPRPA